MQQPSSPMNQKDGQSFLSVTFKINHASTKTKSRTRFNLVRRAFDPPRPAKERIKQAGQFVSPTWTPKTHGPVADSKTSKTVAHRIDGLL